MTKIKITIGPAKADEKDTIRFKDGTVNFSVSVFKGKQGDYYLTYCPALKISGYGSTKEEAVDFMKEEMKVFCEDLLAMNNMEREKFLLSLGFKQERFKRKNFSRAYVDEDGKLQDFEKGTLERSTLHMA